MGTAKFYSQPTVFWEIREINLFIGQNYRKFLIRSRPRIEAFSKTQFHLVNFGQKFREI